MPIKRDIDKLDVTQRQSGAREIGKLRAGMLVPNPNGGRPFPTSLEHIRFTTRFEPAAEALAAKYDSTPNRTTLANGEPTIEVLTKVSLVEAIIPPGEAAISQWREMWGGRVCKRRCDGEMEIKTQQPCMCPVDHIERQALAVNGKACKDKTRINLILPDIPGLVVWGLSTDSYNAGIEVEKTVEWLASLSANGLPLPVLVGIDPRSKVIELPDGKTQTTKFVVWTIDPKHTQVEIAAIASSGSYTLSDALAPIADSLAIGSGSEVVEEKLEALSSGPSVSNADPDDELASPHQKKALNQRVDNLSSPADKATFSTWARNEMKVGGLHPKSQMTIGDLDKMNKKLDAIEKAAGITSAMLGDDIEGAFDDDSEPVDAEIVHEEAMF